MSEAFEFCALMPYEQINYQQKAKVSLLISQLDQQQKNFGVKNMQGDTYQTEIEYLLVLDFEATCVQDQKIQPCAQIIQFPVIVVDCKNAKTIDVFHQYVRPTFNPVLSNFCTQLTGITQEKVDPAQTIDKVLQNLEKWFKSLPYLTPDNYTFVTCGDWDLTTCLKHQIKQKQLFVPKFIQNYINIKKYFNRLLNQQNTGMMGMIKILGIKHQGRHHSGIDDVRNICNVCIQLIKNHNATFPKKQIHQLKFPNALKANTKPKYQQKVVNNKKFQFEYLLILDFEATCEKDQQLKPCSQIIQFPVIVIQTQSLEQKAVFHQYVRPKFNPQLTKFCTQLTGITQQTVSKGLLLQETLQSFDKWMSSLPFLKENNFIFVTCGDWDLTKCLKNEANTKKIIIKEYLQHYINIKKYFPKIAKTRQRIHGMMQMLQNLGLKHQGRHHSGIDDVKNIGKICIELIRQYGAVFPKTELNYVNY